MDIKNFRRACGKKQKVLRTTYKASIV